MIQPMVAIVDSLDLAPRTRGRATARLEIEYAGDLVAADLALLASERGTQPKPIQQLRDRHHALARCLAQGMRPVEAAAVTGYDVSRISILSGDPTFRALVEDYSKIEDGLLAEFTQRATLLSLESVNRLQEALEDEASPLPVSTVLEIAKFAADRTGHAPVQKNVNLNVNAELGDRLRRARARLAQHQAEAAPAPALIESTAVEVTSDVDA